MPNRHKRTLEVAYNKICIYFVAKAFLNTDYHIEHKDNKNMMAQCSVYL